MQLIKCQKSNRECEKNQGQIIMNEKTFCQWINLCQLSFLVTISNPDDV